MQFLIPIIFGDFRTSFVTQTSGTGCYACEEAGRKTSEGKGGVQRAPRGEDAQRRGWKHYCRGMGVYCRVFFRVALLHLWRLFSQLSCVISLLSQLHLMSLFTVLRQCRALIFNWMVVASSGLRKAPQVGGDMPVTSDYLIFFIVGIVLVVSSNTVYVTFSAFKYRLIRRSI